MASELGFERAIVLDVITSGIYKVLTNIFSSYLIRICKEGYKISANFLSKEKNRARKSYFGRFVDWVENNNE